MKITIEIPDPVWFRIAAGAEAHGLDVDDIVAHAIREVMPRRLPRGEDVMRFVRLGFTDRHIAEALGIERPYVSKIRRQAGLAQPVPRTATGTTKTRRAA